MTAAPALEVVAAGLLTSVQDAGRPGHGELGVPVGGACDPISLAVANLLVGNGPGEAALECTLLGPELRAEGDVLIGLAGADLGAEVLPAARRLLPGRAWLIRDRETLRMPGPADARAGCRAYVAIAGGIDVPEVLGSRSTSLVGAFGGLDGRALRAGDRVRTGDRERDRGRAPTPWPPSSDADGSLAEAAVAVWPAHLPLPSPDDPVRILAAPRLDDSGWQDGAFRALLERAWRVAPDSDRRGLRLDGPPIEAIEPADRPSHGMLPGAIQLTPSGQPVALLVDAGPTGGYPVIGVAIRADLGILGQARPGQMIRFVATDLEAARRASVQLRATLDAGRRRLGGSDSQGP